MARHCPDFVIELLSSSDRLPKAQAKMKDWIANGAKLVWLIDPTSARPRSTLPGRLLKPSQPIPSAAPAPSKASASISPKSGASTKPRQTSSQRKER
jgi:hypothetical protein